MGKQKKTKRAGKPKKMKEPAYLTSATQMTTINYRVYYMKPLEKIGYFLLAFTAAAAVGYLFYGGIGKNEFGDPTKLTRILDIAIPAAIGLIGGILFLPERVKAIRAKRKRELKRQFRDMLDALSAALGAGKNVTDAFQSVYEDLKIQYDEGAYILRELEVILGDTQNNIPIEQVLEDFGKRSDIEDIQSFASVFKISYRMGGNMKDIIRNTHNILTDKMEIAEDIETLVTSNRMEQNIMIVMPIILIALIKGLSPELARNFVSASGLISTTFSIMIFLIAYRIGKLVLDIKI